MQGSAVRAAQRPEPHEVARNRHLESGFDRLRALRIDVHVLPTVRIRRVVAQDEASNREALRSLEFSAVLDVEYPLGMLLDEE